jgi:hypothetical protein
MKCHFHALEGMVDDGDCSGGKWPMIFPLLARTYLGAPPKTRKQRPRAAERGG